MIDVINIPPTKQSAHTRAWRVDLPAAVAKAGLQPDQDAAVAAWVIQAPWAHPLWHSYYLFGIHLRQLPSFPTPTIRLPGATHELQLWALSPQFPREEAITSGIFQRMIPANFISQVIAADDDAMRKIVEHTVDEIVAGVLSPDTDFRRMWVERFGSNMFNNWD